MGLGDNLHNYSPLVDDESVLHSASVSQPLLCVRMCFPHLIRGWGRYTSVTSCSLTLQEIIFSSLKGPFDGGPAFFLLHTIPIVNYTLHIYALCNGQYEVLSPAKGSSAVTLFSVLFAALGPFRADPWCVLVFGIRLTEDHHIALCRERRQEGE